MMSRLFGFLTVGLALFFAFAMVGCSGGNSSNQPQEAAQVEAVTVTDNGSVATMEVAFRLSDDGEPVSGVDPNNIRFSVAKLIGEIEKLLDW